MQLHSLRRDPAAPVLLPLPGVPATTSLGGWLHLLESFPGPLGPNTSKDKVRAAAAWRRVCVGGKSACMQGCVDNHFRVVCVSAVQVATFCAERAGLAGGDAAPQPPYHHHHSSDSNTQQQTLWAVLRVLALHQGRISSAPYTAAAQAANGASSKPFDPAATPESQLTAALLAGMPEALEQPLLLPGAAPAADAAEAAAEAQRLLLAGRREEALRYASVCVVGGGACVQES